MVAALLPEVVDYNREYGEVLHLAEDALAFVAALRKALTGTSSAMRDRYRQVARQNSRTARVGDMSNLIEEALKNQSRVSGKGKP